MKRKTVWTWLGIVITIALFGGLNATAFGFRVVVADPESDLGIILEPVPDNTPWAGKSRDAVVLHPEKLAVLGLSQVKQGDRIRLVHQVSNLWRIWHPESQGVIPIRLKLKRTESSDYMGKY